MLFGSKVKGGIYGSNPNLTDFDNNANLLHEFDFRQLYATLMTQWFELEQEDIENILFHPFETFPIIDNRFPQVSYPSNKEAVLGIPKDYVLSKAYPNPFNPNTRLQYAVKEKGYVDIIIYDLKGRKILHPVHELKAAGFYSLDIKGGNWPSGTYLVKMATKDFRKTRKIALLK